MLAEKIYKIQKELEEKRKSRRQQTLNMQGSAGQPSLPQQPQQGVPHQPLSAGLHQSQVPGVHNSMSSMNGTFHSLTSLTTLHFTFITTVSISINITEMSSPCRSSVSAVIWSWLCAQLLRSSFSWTTQHSLCFHDESPDVRAASPNLHFGINGGFRLYGITGE